jgi:hypothetical protein
VRGCPLIWTPTARMRSNVGVRCTDHLLLPPAHRGAGSPRRAGSLMANRANHAAATIRHPSGRRSACAFACQGCRSLSGSYPPHVRDQQAIIALPVQAPPGKKTWSYKWSRSGTRLRGATGLAPGPVRRLWSRAGTRCGLAPGPVDWISSGGTQSAHSFVGACPLQGSIATLQAKDSLASWWPAAQSISPKCSSSRCCAGSQAATPTGHSGRATAGHQVRPGDKLAHALIRTSATMRSRRCGRKERDGGAVRPHARALTAPSCRCGACKHSCTACD